MKLIPPMLTPILCSNSVFDQICIEQIERESGATFSLIDSLCSSSSFRGVSHIARKNLDLFKNCARTAPKYISRKCSQITIAIFRDFWPATKPKSLWFYTMKFAIFPNFGPPNYLDLQTWFVNNPQTSLLRLHHKFPRLSYGSVSLALRHISKTHPMPMVDFRVLAI